MVAPGAMIWPRSAPAASCATEFVTSWRSALRRPHRCGPGARPRSALATRLSERRQHGGREQGGIDRARPRRWRACRPGCRRASGRSRAGCPCPSAPGSRSARRARAGGVMEAVMPGRWAAPPAPAMITLSPRSARGLGIGIEPLRRAMGGDDARLEGDAQRFQRLGGALHGLPVGLAAHDDSHCRLFAGHRRWRSRDPEGPAL